MNLNALYNVLSVDPPWQFEDVNTGGSMASGAGQVYSTLSLDDLTQIPVQAVLRPHAVCFLWAVVPMLPEAFALLKAWDFAYVTKFEWVKDYGGNRMGMGRWHRGGTEPILVGVRGDVEPFGLQEPSWFRTLAGRHSEKPEHARLLFERATRKMHQPTRLELFARERVDGWTCLGNEIDGKDIRVALRDLAAEIYSATPARTR